MSNNQDHRRPSPSEGLARMGRGAEAAPGASGAVGERAPSISLPKGGGAIRGIGEKFAANPVTGAGSMTVPLATSTGRSGFGPQLTLSYDSGAGNGPFGFGWTLSLPTITRKTDKGLPQYRDALELDVFIISGAEDLVPILQPDGSRYEDVASAPGYTIHRYHPRVEGLFARIERWTEKTTGDTHWRSISRDNVTTLYGKTQESRVADPADPLRVFSWLICESFDDKGNAVVYRYAAEDGENVDHSQVNERNRERSANRYPKRIQYGNRVSRLTHPDLTMAEWLFDVVFDYDEGHYEALAPAPGLPEAEQHRLVRATSSTARPWSARPDQFSSYRAGFEVRTYRRCRRVLMFHCFDELGDEPYLVRSTEFDYADLDYSQPTTVEAELAHQGSTRFASFIRAVIQSGFVRDDGQPTLERDGVEYVTYLRKSLPPLEFEYSKAVIQDEVRETDADSLENLPAGLDGASYRWVDLDGEGVSGILTEQAGAWFYKPNMGEGRFGPLKAVKSRPSLAHLNGGRQELLDIDGDGRLNLVAFSGPTPGFYERTQDEDWEPFKSFARLPNIRWDEPNLRFVDLDGDGHADILITENEVLTWYPSLAEEGFASARHARKSFDEERGPRLVLADGTQSVYLADMSGDGLTDLVRVRNGEVCYWPNLGYGHFGAKVAMDNAPLFDNPDQFSQRRVRMADIDGSGTTDIIYLGRDGARLYFNQSGNRWSGPRRLSRFPLVDNLSSVTTADLLGNGTACLVWSSPLPDDARSPLRYIDLMGGQKPHLLVRSVNNLGAETLVRYAPSTRFYLADKCAGRPWLTRVPFPVHVIESVETRDHIGRSRFVTRYAYHHGYFDGVEREFRGFGIVEQWDTEEFAALAGGDLPASDNLGAASHVPPVHTKTWFHTGVFIGRHRVSGIFAGTLDGQERGEYYREPAWLGDDFEAGRRLLDDTVLPSGLTADEEREACRSLKGTMLRQEVYALDGTDKAQHPYTVTEQNFTIRVLQRRGGNRHAVFLTHAREAVNYHYERNPSDPRVTHALTLKVDEYGNVLRSLSISYPRANVPARQPEQNETHLTLTLNRFANRDDQTDWRHIGLPVETRTYEVVKPPTTSLRFTWQELSDLVEALVPLTLFEPPTAKTIPYEQWDWRRQWNPQTEPGGPANTRLRLIEHARTLYRPDDLGGSQNDPLALLPLGTVESLALPGDTHRLAFTPGLLAEVYGGWVSDQMLETEAGYVHSEGDMDWWIPSGRVFLSPHGADTPTQELAHARRHFFLPRRYRDPFGQETNVAYDDYDLLTAETRDPLGNRVTAGERDASNNLNASGNDYRVLQPALLMDANRNRSAVAFDALGLVVGTAVMGKPSPAPAEGDALDGFEADPTEAVILAHLANPLSNPQSILARATTRLVYDLFAYHRTKNQSVPHPAVVYTLTREIHDSDPVPASGLKTQHGFSYSDGFGREIQKKIQAEPGPAPARDGGGKITLGEDHLPSMTAHDVSPRWVGSGWTVFNNKGKPVRQYEPFFTDTHRFEFDLRIGVSPVIFYDPVERVVATLHPNHTWEKVVFDPWRQETWDVNDTLLVADPADDPDVGGLFRSLPVADYLPTWYVRRQGGALGAREKAAAIKSAIHAGTPNVTHFDSLSRTFLTVAHNRYKYSDAPATDAPAEEFHSTRVVLDIEGNQREVLDAKDRLVMKYDYCMAGPEGNKDEAHNRIHQASMEAGERWMLNDVAGKPLYARDSRNQQFRITYDQLRRPVGSFMREGAGAELMVGRTAYGETQANPEANNLRGKVFQVFDQAGVVTTDDYDFKGNLLRGRRQLAEEYRTTLDWSAAIPLDAPIYVSLTSYDALNRPTELTAPDDSRVRPVYNEANLLERVDVNLRGARQNGQPVWTPFVTNINYDAKGQRTLIDYGNGARTTYRYDPLTFRLTRLLTRRRAADFPDDCPEPPPDGWPGCQVQNLRYTYDPAGNITHIRDRAQQTVYFRNRRVEPSAEYTYDALYRLIEATGREHLGQAGTAPSPGSYDDRPRVGILLSASDGNAIGRYLERYVYDKVGNFLKMTHRGSDPSSPGWTRAYAYNEASLLEPNRQSNRLTHTTVGATNETYSAAGDGYDAHGNMLRMPQLQAMLWDFKDQLRMTRRQAVNADDHDGLQRQGERTWYVYDAAGQRVRKVTELSPGQIKEERIYLGGFEIYRRRGTNPLTRETLHVTDDKQRIALVETRTQGTDPAPRQLVRYQLGNHLGSANLELDDQSQIISYEEYTPFGGTSYQAVRSQTETPKRYRYTGKERDEETGLTYHGARYYAPWLGRWVSPDPAGLVDGVNLYVYVNNSPTVKVDDSGHQGIFPGDDPNKRINVASTTATAKPYVQKFGPQYFSMTVGDTKIAVFNPRRLTYSDYTKTLSKPQAQATVVGPDDSGWNDSHLSEGAQAGRNTRLALDAYKGDSFWMKVSIVAYHFGALAINTMGGAVTGGYAHAQKTRLELTQHTKPAETFTKPSGGKPSIKLADENPAANPKLITRPKTTLSGKAFEKAVIKKTGVKDLNDIDPSFRVVDAYDPATGDIPSIASGSMTYLLEKLRILLGVSGKEHVWNAALKKLTNLNLITSEADFMMKSKLWVPTESVAELKSIAETHEAFRLLREQYGTTFITDKIVGHTVNH